MLGACFSGLPPRHTPWPEVVLGAGKLHGPEVVLGMGPDRRCAPAARLPSVHPGRHPLHRRGAGADSTGGGVARKGRLCVSRRAEAGAFARWCPAKGPVSRRCCVGRASSAPVDGRQCPGPPPFRALVSFAARRPVRAGSLSVRNCAASVLLGVSPAPSTTSGPGVAAARCAVAARAWVEHHLGDLVPTRLRGGHQRARIDSLRG